MISETSLQKNRIEISRTMNLFMISKHVNYVRDAFGWCKETNPLILLECGERKER
jgi:hypothetical protein